MVTIHESPLNGSKSGSSGIHELMLLIGLFSFRPVAFSLFTISFESMAQTIVPVVVSTKCEFFLSPLIARFEDHLNRFNGQKDFFIGVTSIRSSSVAARGGPSPMIP